MILYEMFAGQLPFKGSFAELITHHLITVPEPPSRHRPMPPALDQLILRCLDKDPAQRPQTADELWRALETALPAPGSEVASPPPQAAASPAPQPAPTTDPPGDTLSPPPGRTANDLTVQPPRQRGPLVWALAAGAAAAIAIAIVVGARNGGGDKGSLVVVSDAQPPPATTAAKPVPGRAHVVVKGVEVARVLVDGKLVAAGVREARVLDLAPGESHALRVEAVDRTPHERVFTVAAGAEAELEVSLAPPAPAEPHIPPRAPGAKTRRHDTVATPGITPTTPPAATSKPRHRDGLVGDDIFDGAR
jgi:hypothetical protein